MQEILFRGREFEPRHAPDGWVFANITYVIMKTKRKVDIRMTYKQIETMRQIRLMIVDVAVPVITAGVTILTIPEVRQAIGNKLNKIKESRNRKKIKIVK